MNLLAHDESPPVLIERADAASPFVITCDHAGKRLPRSLGDLGVNASERERHIAWDIGALGVAQALARALDGVLIAQRYSRLVIDCNRPPDSADLICTRSENTDIPGNCDLAPSARAVSTNCLDCSGSSGLGFLGFAIALFPFSPGFLVNELSYRPTASPLRHATMIRRVARHSRLPE